MVVSLNELCLLSVRNSMIDGILPNNLQNVSTRLRRLIFETLVARQKLSDPNCLNYMDDLLFDDSLCAIEALPKQKRRRCRLERDTYDRFMEFLQTKFEDFPDLADRITTLRLATVSVHSSDETIYIGSKRYSDVPEDLCTVLKLITLCKNLKHLSIVNGRYLTFIFPNWLEALAEAVHCSGSSGLETLEVTCCESQECQFAPTPNQTLAFRQLKSLHLQYVGLTEVGWTRLLECCHTTLENLVLYGVTFGFVDVVPITLYELTSLNVDRVWCELNLANVTARCPKLRSCHFDLNAAEMVDDSVSEIKLLLRSLVDCCISLLIDESLPVFLNELLDVAQDKITKLDLCIREDWTEVGIRRLILGCRNLRALEVFDYPTDELKAVLEKCLRDLFYDKERAGKLLKLKVHASLSTATLDPLFANCINLDVLELTGGNARPNDRHLEIWTERGARPSRLHLEFAQVSCGRLKLLIAASGSNLTNIYIGHCYPEKMDSVFETLMRCCPMLKFVNIPGVSEHIQCHFGEFSRNLFYLDTIGWSVVMNKVH